jgi:hypothetical protein
MNPTSLTFVIIKIDFVLFLLICGGVVAINFCVLFFWKKGMASKRVERRPPNISA